MKNSITYIIHVLLLAIAYFITGKLSLFLAIPPGFATPVWPAAGIALAAILKGGYRLLPGVFIGSFATNLLIAVNAGASLAMIAPYVVGAGIAVGATLQATFSSYLVKRVLVLPTALNKVHQVIDLLSRGGFVGCCVNGIIGPSVLLTAGVISYDAYWSSIFTWWAGDVIGVMLLTPVMLLLVNVSVSTMRKLFVFCPIIVFGLLTISIFFDTKNIMENSVNDAWGLWYLLIGGLLLSALFGGMLLIISANTEYIQKELASEVGDELKKSTYHRSSFILCSRVLGGLTLLLGGVVLIGWHMGHASFIQVYHSFAPMQYNTALAFVFSAIGLCALSFSAKRILLISGLLVLSIGMLTLYQYIASVSLGVDQLLMRYTITTETSYPGRMAPNTALCFVLLGTLFTGYRFLSRYTSMALIFKIIGGVIIALGAVALVGYMTDVQSAYGWTDRTHMAIHTAIGLILLGLGVVTYALHSISLSWRSSAPVWLAAITFWIALLFTVALWHEFKQQEKEFIQTSLEEKSDQIKQSISSHFYGTVIALERMAQRWEVRQGTPKSEWQVDAQHYVEDFKTLSVVEWVDKTYHVRWVEPMEGNESAQDLYILFNKEREEAFRTLKKGEMHLTPPLDLVQGYRGVISYVPIYINQHFDGMIVGVFDIDTFLSSVISSRIREQFSFQIYDGSKEVFSSDNGGDRQLSWLHNDVVDLLNRQWVISLWPKNSFIGTHKSYAPEIALLGGILFSLLAGFVVYSALISNRRGHLLYKQSADLRESEERLNAILETAPDGILSIKDDSTIMLANQAAAKIFNYSEAELIGKNITKLFAQESHNNNLLDTVKMGRGRKVISGIEVLGVRKDGSVVSLEVGFNNSTMPDGTSHVVVAVKDITERKEVESHLNRTMEDLRYSNTELEKFAYVASHDLKSPLRAINNLSCWLEEDLTGELNENSKRHLDNLRGRVRRMDSFLDSLLEYSRVGKESEEPHITNAYDLIAGVKELLDIPEGFTIKVSPALKAVEVYSMPLEQVCHNLISNAIKHHDQSTGNITISVEEHTEYYIFSISDDGPGIPAKFHNKVFEMFQTLKPRDEVEGSGMGLALVQKIIYRVGGKLKLESSEGNGSNFLFTWPKIGMDMRQQEYDL